MSISGVRPEMRSAITRPEPQAMVQPSVPWPVLRCRLAKRVAPITGHGTLGWTMACGSGRVLADMLSGKKPEIDTKELSIKRYDVRFG